MRGTASTILVFSLFLSSFCYTLLFTFINFICEILQFIITTRIHYTSMEHMKLISRYWLLQYMIPLSSTPWWARISNFMSELHVTQKVLKNASSAIRHIILISRLSNSTKICIVKTRGKIITNQHFAIKVIWADDDCRIFEIERDVLFSVPLISANEIMEVKKQWQWLSVISGTHRSRQHTNRSVDYTKLLCRKIRDHIFFLSISSNWNDKNKRECESYVSWQIYLYWRCNGT